MGSFALSQGRRERYPSSTCGTEHSGRDRRTPNQAAGPLAEGNRTVPEREDERLQARVDPQFAKDVHHVGAHRLVADAEPLGNLLVIQAVGQRRQDLPLPWRKPVKGCPFPPIAIALLTDKLEQLDGFSRREQGLPL